MKISFIPAMALTLLSIACSGNGQKTNNASDNKLQTADADIRGQWYIENIVFNDSVYVRPSEEVPDVRQYIIFEDSTYSIMTNCNAMSGLYTLKGDSIKFGDGAMTELACDNMATEEALRKILPHINTVDVENDSIARLNSDTSSEYIVLRKATEIK